MKVGITTIVTSIEDKNVELRIEYEDDVLEFYLSDELIFAGDWTNNFKEVCRKLSAIIDTAEQ